ncbi:hypothetical protein JW979_13050 [bacterium]|nr:hypothetical protein [candidate division CSSED10-310 bacterium]
MNKVLSNIGLLDLRNATEESIKDIAVIKNVGVVIYSAETAHLLSKLNIGNMGSSLEVSSDFKILTGQMFITGDYLATLSEPLNILVTGQLMIRPDVTPEDIKMKIGKLVVIGQLMCPNKLMPLIQSKLVDHVGQNIVYPDNGKLLIGTTHVNTGFLQSLPVKTSLVCIGKLSLTESVSNDLFTENIDRVHMTGKIIVREDLHGILQKHLDPESQYKLEIIPLGYEMIDKPLHLDALSIKRFKKAKLYTKHYLYIDKDIDAKMLTTHIEKLHSKSIILCHKDLCETLLELCSGDDVKVLPFAEKLLIVDGEEELTAEDLEYIDGKLTILILGTLTVKDTVTPDQLMDKIDQIDNLGVIVSDAGRLGAIKAKLRTRKGQMMDRNAPQEETPPGMQNVGYLKL